MFEGMMTRMLDRVNATPEQRTQIQQIMQSQASEMRAQREAGRALRQQAMALFAQPTVDADAVEALRQQQLAMHDAASKRMTAAMLEISRVLTPEQRKQMAEHMAQRSEMMQRHHARASGRRRAQELRHGRHGPAHDWLPACRRALRSGAAGRRSALHRRAMNERDCC